MNLFNSIPALCQWTVLLLSLFIAVRGSMLFSYYQKIGTVSLYYLYVALFGVSASVLQSAHIVTEILELPPQLIFFKFVISLLICINFVGFMYLLWKRPHKIGMLRISILTALSAFVMIIVPLVDGEKLQQGLVKSTFNLWFYPVSGLAFLLLLSILYYYWRIAHFKNGLSVIVIFSLIPFMASTLLTALSAAGNYSTISYIFYALSFLPLSIKLITEGFDSGHKLISYNYSGGVGK